MRSIYAKKVKLFKYLENCYGNFDFYSVTSYTGGTLTVPGVVTKDGFRRLNGHYRSVQLGSL